MSNFAKRFAKLLINPFSGKPPEKPSRKFAQMAKEIERKFIVTDDTYKQLATASRHITQGYISRRKEGTVRVRLLDDRAFLTVKGITEGITRNEWEYEISPDDAREMLRTTCEGNIVEKTRYIVPFGGLTWEVDNFTSPRPMTVAEVELPSECTQITQLPPFVGEEVSGNPAYYNSSL